MDIAEDAGGGGGDSGDGEDGTMGPDGLSPDLSGRDACGVGSCGNGGEGGRMGLEADSGTASEVEGALMVLMKLRPQLRHSNQALGGMCDAGLVALDRKKKKKRGPRGGEQQRPSGYQRKAFFRAHERDGK